MPIDISLLVPMALSIGAQKLGHPVPLSYLVVDENSSRSQPAQAKVPRRFSLRSWLVNGRSVAALRRTAYWFGVSSLFHSSSVLVTSNTSAAASGEEPSQKAPPA